MAFQREKGFTLIEVAIVMVILGLVMGGGLAIMRTLSERKFRNDSIEYLNRVKEAIITFAQINGRVPWADAVPPPPTPPNPPTPQDGNEDINLTKGLLPFITIGITRSDAYKRPVAYEINSSLAANNINNIRNMVTTCNSLMAGLSGRPQIIDADAGAGSAVSVAAVIISSGPMDADNDGNVFDTIAGASGGNNVTGTPNYIRSPPTATFDDLAVYITWNELFGKMCETLVLTVIDETPPTTFYVRDTTRGIDLGSAPGAYRIISGTAIGIYSGSGGTGGLVTTIPPTPITFAGQGYTIRIP